MNGNMLPDGANAFFLECKESVATLNSISLQYDAFGRRIQNSGDKAFLYDGANTAQELSGSTVTTNLLSGGIDEATILLVLKGLFFERFRQRQRKLDPAKIRQPCKTAMAKNQPPERLFFRDVEFDAHDSFASFGAGPLQGAHIRP
jgi:hypothetical protein